jgi:hypothetical protein
MLDGRYSESSLTPKKALVELIKHKGNRYSPEVVDLVIDHPILLDTTPKETNMTIDRLEPGMILQQDILTENKMLLPEGHVFTQKTVDRIKQFQNSLPKHMPLAVSSPLHKIKNS